MMCHIIKPVPSNHTDKRVRKLSAFVLVSLIVGIFLWFGAITKGYQIATEPIAENKWFAIFSCQYEWFLGLLLILGIYPRLVRPIAMATFVLFSAVSIRLAIQGAQSCGCFGAVHVDPRITLTLDLMVVISLLMVRPSSLVRQFSLTRGRRALLSFGVMIAVVGFYFMWQYEPSKLAFDGQVLGGTKEVLIEPTDWLDKPCPLLGLPTIDSQLASGKWIVLLHHSDCPGCQEMLSAWPKSVLHYAPAFKTAIISASPQMPQITKSIIRKHSTVICYLPDAYKWFVPTPTILCLENGYVTKTVVQGETSIARPCSTPSLPNPKKMTFRPEAIVKKSHETEKKITVATGCEYNFNYVEPKSIHKMRFILDNPTDDDWIIRSVRSECDCMKCIDAPKSLLAGKSTPITIEFKSPKEPQEYLKQLIVFTDSKKTPNVKYCLKARIGLPLRVVPATIDLDQSPRKEEYEKVIQVVNDGKKPVKLLYSTSNDSSCYARVPIEPIAGGERVKVPVVFGPSETPPKRACEIRLHTNYPNQQVLRVLVRGSAESDKEIKHKPR